MKNQTLPTHYTITQAADRLGISKEAISAAAKRNGWDTVSIGNVRLILKADVHDYRDHQYRTQLVKALGWAGRGLYRNEDIDIECPECGGFAVEWPALDPNVFLCLKGHRGEDYFDGGQTSPD